jgi:hypothetical protein
VAVILLYSLLRNTTDHTRNNAKYRVNTDDNRTDNTDQTDNTTDNTPKHAKYRVNTGDNRTDNMDLPNNPLRRGLILRLPSS